MRRGAAPGRGPGTVGVNLFLAALATDPIEKGAVARVLREIASRIPYLRGEPLTEDASPDRRRVVAWMCHGPERVGGINYAAVEGGTFALFAGRPILRTTGAFDGRGALDPGLYLRPREAWEDRLDGRFVVVRCDEGPRLSVTTDPIGAYPVFTAEADGIHWVGNNAGALALATGATAFDELALASVLAVGWSFGGHPLWRSVRRLAPNATHVFRHDAVRGGVVASSAVRRAVSSVGSGEPLDAREAARVLVAVTQAMMDWPGRPLALALSGGRDSRLAFAAAVSGPHTFRAKTVSWPYEAGFPNGAEVRVAHALCEIAGVPHRIELGDQPFDVRRTAGTVAALTPGTVGLGDAGLPPLSCPPGPLELQVTGHGAETARSREGIGFETPGAASEALYRHRIHLVPAPIVNDAGLELVRGWLHEWTARRAAEGVAVAALGDAFHIEERLAGWSSGVHGVFEYWSDTVSPLWTAALTPFMLTCPGPLRLRDGFHNLVLRELSPELWRVPFAGVMPRWPSLHERRLRSGRAGAAYRNLRKVQAEVRRRGELRRRGHSGVYGDAIVDAQRLARELTSASPDHAAWALLNRRRVEHLLAADARAMHPRSRQLIWRVLAVFAAGAESDPRTRVPTPEAWLSGAGQAV